VSQSTVGMIAWARKRPYALWPVKWPLVVIGLIVLWLLGPVFGGWSKGVSDYPQRQFPGSK
jgi:hypothetical protein